MEEGEPFSWNCDWESDAPPEASHLARASHPPRSASRVPKCSVFLKEPELVDYSRDEARGETNRLSRRSCVLPVRHPSESNLHRSQTPHPVPNQGFQGAKNEKQNLPSGRLHLSSGVK
jgi:hypothetical protein